MNPVVWNPTIDILLQGVDTVFGTCGEDGIRIWSDVDKMGGREVKINLFSKFQNLLLISIPLDRLKTKH